MADVSKINVNSEIYNIKDATARQNVSELEANLGDLAYKDTATGSYTPSGTITAPTIDVTPSSKNVQTITSVGTLPAWGASVSDEELSFTFNTGTLPAVETNSVVTNISDATASAPVFNGTPATITVS